MNTLHGRVAVITGAGSGVGRAIAGTLADQGATVCLVGRTPATLEAAAMLSIPPTSRLAPTPPT